MANQNTKFEISSLNYSRDILRKLKIYKKLCSCRGTGMCHKYETLHLGRFATAE